jgi:4'-phosphopantetheinyl transferase EntD
MPVLDPSVRPSSDLQSLFPRNVVVMESFAEGDPGSLSAGEAACLGRALPKRVREFAAGRHCARRALERFGLTGWDLRVREDRTPVWPEGFVGSISHTAGFCAAAVGSRQEFRSIGLDVEIALRVTPDLYTAFLTPGEQAAIGRMPSEAADKMATLLFSAKEAFYKCQYPITSEWLEFADIEVDMPANHLDRGGLNVRPARSLAFERKFPLPWHGNFLIFGGFVATGFVFPLDRTLEQPVDR